MITEANSKVTASHLNRDAYLYVRQSTLRQVFENQESTKRQYALRNRAIALGWPGERIQVIDSDLGHSGASSTDREGFQKLVAEVGMGRAGIVLGLEVSRLARNNTDWHRLLEICALTETLILDEDGLYNPNDFNDRLLLGLKGTMSEAELHFIQTRMWGGILSKARRGDFPCRLPTGFVYDDQGKVQLHPDQQVRQAITLLFATYRRTGSGSATVKYFREQGFLFPRRVNSKYEKNELHWGPLTHYLVMLILHNPRYAGAYFYGRTHTTKRADGKNHLKKLPRDEWHTLITEAHEGYIKWEEFEENQRLLLASAQAHGRDRRQSPPREGAALLQGIVICGVCGKRMLTCYRWQGDRAIPIYKCEREAIQYRSSICQSITGDEIDRAVGSLLLNTITPLAMEAALAVQKEVSTRQEEAERLRMQQVERARYEADLARRRYMLVDPDNRLVVVTLEAEWNEKLRVLREAKDDCERRREEEMIQINREVERRVKKLTTDFPQLWNDPGTSHRDRKRIVRLLVRDVTLSKREEIAVHVCFKGGTTTTLTLPIPKYAYERHRTAPVIIEQITELAQNHTDRQIAQILNERGHQSGRKQDFRENIVKNLRKRYGLKSCYEHFRESGMLTSAEIAKQLNVTTGTVISWRRAGLLTGHLVNDKNEYLYDPPDKKLPGKHMGKRLTDRFRKPEPLSKPIIEEQYEV